MPSDNQRLTLQLLPKRLPELRSNRRRPVSRIKLNTRTKQMIYPRSGIRVNLWQPKTEVFMPVTVNVRHLENKNVHLEGELRPEELDLEPLDEMVHANEPLNYDLEIEQNGANLLIHGELHLTLDCECVRCLRPFEYAIDIEPYDALVPLEGEDKAVVNNDVVDLTPYLREDILLAFPQHPLCEAECDRLPPSSESKHSGTSAQGEKSAWDELNKLKLK